MESPTSAEAKTKINSGPKPLFLGRAGVASEPLSSAPASAVLAPAKIVDSGAEAEVKTRNVRSLADRLGICLSALCVVHCLLTPFLLLLIPALEVSAYHEVFHEGLLMILPLLALAAFIPGFRRHRDRRVFYWGVPGLVLIALGALVFHDQVWGQVIFSVTGSLLLIRAHLINRNLCACCETGHGARRGFRAVKRAARLLSAPPRR